MSGFLSSLIFVEQFLCMKYISRSQFLHTGPPFSAGRNFPPTGLSIQRASNVSIWISQDHFLPCSLPLESLGFVGNLVYTPDFANSMKRGTWSSFPRRDPPSKVPDFQVSVQTDAPFAHGTTIPNQNSMFDSASKCYIVDEEDYCAEEQHPVNVDEPKETQSACENGGRREKTKVVNFGIFSVCDSTARLRSKLFENLPAVSHVFKLAMGVQLTLISFLFLSWLCDKVYGQVIKGGVLLTPSAV